MRSKPHSDEPDLHHDRLPDAISAAVRSLMTRMDEMEQSLNMHMEEHPILVSNGPNGDSYLPVGELDLPVPVMLHSPGNNGAWHGEDFMI